jgi:ribosomal protein S18 acetylase RimI-like enzyme
VRARKAETRDVEAICRICAEGWRDTYAELYDSAYIERTIQQFYVPERVCRELDACEGWDGWWVAEDEQGVVVAAGGGGSTAPGIAEVFVLYADPARRGAGAGTVVLEAITDQQRARGALEQWVSVEPENDKGLPFYRARGFVEQGTRPAYAADADDTRESLRLVRPI